MHHFDDRPHMTRLITLPVVRRSGAILAPTLLLASGLVAGPAAAVAPNAPTDVIATAHDVGAHVAWSAPSDGGSPITAYTVTSSPGARTCTDMTAALSCDVTGLTNGTPYTFTVTATNADGT